MLCRGNGPVDKGSVIYSIIIITKVVPKVCICFYWNIQINLLNKIRKCGGEEEIGLQQRIEADIKL